MQKVCLRRDGSEFAEEWTPSVRTTDRNDVSKPTGQSTQDMNDTSLSEVQTPISLMKPVQNPLHYKVD